MARRKATVMICQNTSPEPVWEVWPAKVGARCSGCKKRIRRGSPAVVYVYFSEGTKPTLCKPCSHAHGIITVDSNRWRHMQRDRYQLLDEGWSEEYLPPYRSPEEQVVDEIAKAEDIAAAERAMKQQELQDKDPTIATNEPDQGSRRFGGYRLIPAGQDFAAPSKKTRYQKKQENWARQEKIDANEKAKSIRVGHAFLNPNFYHDQFGKLDDHCSSEEIKTKSPSDFSRKRKPEVEPKLALGPGAPPPCFKKSGPSVAAWAGRNPMMRRAAKKLGKDHGSIAWSSYDKRSSQKIDHIIRVEPYDKDQAKEFVRKWEGSVTRRPSSDWFRQQQQNLMEKYRALPRAQKLREGAIYAPCSQLLLS